MPELKAPAENRLPALAVTALLAAVGIARLAAMYSFQVFDDAFITYRYSANLVEGHGLLYNIGERVQGITCPLWGLGLAPCFQLGLGVEWLPRILGLIIDVLTAWVVLRTLVRENLGWAAFMTVFLFAIDPYLAKTAVGGMESSAFLLGTVWSSVLALRGRTSAAAIIAGLCYFLRPEALLFAIVLIAYVWVKEHRFPVYPVLIGVGIIAAGVLAEYLYYGTLIPQSVKGKFVYAGSFRRMVDIVIFPRTDPLQALLTVTTLIGLPLAWKRSELVRLFGLWALLLFGAWTVAHAYLWAWYCVPVYFFKCLVTGVALGVAAERFEIIRRLKRLASPAVLGGLVVLFWAVLAIHTGPDPVRTQVYTPLRAWAHGRDLRSQSSYGVDFGAFGLYTGARIIDGPGLVYPPSVEKYHQDTRQILLGERPDWAYMTYTRDQMSVILSPEFAAEYRPVARFSEHGDTALVFPPVDQISTTWSHDFVLFRRVSAP